jgi:hypothetical protein
MKRKIVAGVSAIFLFLLFVSSAHLKMYREGLTMIHKAQTVMLNPVMGITPKNCLA